MGRKTIIQVFLEPDEIEMIDQIAKKMTDIKLKEDIKNKVPPSKRGRRVSRSKAARFLLLEGVKWSGM
ncbi:hypothetical protein V6C27_04295 [Peptococcaceae bacterium 1198_IL3148]